MIAASDMVSVPLSRGWSHLTEMALIGIRKDFRLFLAVIPLAIILTLAMGRWVPGADADLLSALVAAPLIGLYLVIRLVDALPSPTPAQLEEARHRLGKGSIARAAKWVVGAAQLTALVCFVTAAIYAAIGLTWAGSSAMVAGAFALLATTVALLLFSVCLRVRHHVHHAVETVAFLAAVLVHMKSEDLRHRLNAGIASIRF